MLSHQQFKTFLEMQIQTNERVNPLWMSANYPFLRAALMEATESIEHHGWYLEGLQCSVTV